MKSAGTGDVLVDAGRLLLACEPPTAPGAPAGAAGLLASTLVTADLSDGRGPLAAVLSSVALYRCAPAAFRDWNRAQGEPLRARLGPTGLVSAGDAVTDTALVLLALQSPYRSY
jgi:hypothetical protein